MKNLITVQKYGRKTFGRLRNEWMDGLGENQDYNWKYIRHYPISQILNLFLTL